MAEAVDGLQDLALTWSGRALDVSRIETELGKLRYLAAGEPAGGEGFAIRASILNMVVYAEHEDGANNASRVIEDLASHHPSRALIIVARPSDEDSHIEAQLAAHCHINADLEQQVCCEEVTLHVSGRSASHLHSIIIPLLVPDLPVYVWWTERLPEESHLLAGLVETSDRFIVDSGHFGNPAADLLRLARLGDAHPGTTLGDLNWDRLLPWCELIQGQRQVADLHHHLASVQSVEVRYAAGGETDPVAQCFLFLSWLSGVLGWNTSAVSGHGRERLTLRHEDRQISVYLVPVPYPAIDPGWLVGVKIVCESEGKRALLTLSRTGDPYHITVRSEHADNVAEDSVRVEPATPADTLVYELNTPVRDPAYTRVLQGAVPLIEAAHAAP